jgi:hypothetical protein
MSDLYDAVVPVAVRRRLSLNLCAWRLRDRWKLRAERLLASLIMQLLDEQRKKCLRDTGVTALPLYKVNEVIRAYGWEIRSEAGPSEGR